MSGDSEAFQFFNEISIINQLAGTMFDRVLPKGMTRAQFGVLNHFVRLEPGEQSPADLAWAFQVSRATMSSTLARLRAAHLVFVRPDPADGRAKLVSITDNGRAMRDHCIAALAPLWPLLGTIVTRDDVAAALPVLQKVRKGLDAMRGSARR